jgi:ERCC4-type nuclease
MSKYEKFEVPEGTLYIDDREKNPSPEAIMKMLAKHVDSSVVDMRIKRVPFGDILYNGFAIERKSAADFVQSVVSTSIFTQAMNSTHLIIVGDWRHALIGRDNNLSIYNMCLGAIASLSTKFGMSVINVLDHDEYAYVVGRMIMKHVDGPTGRIFDYKKSGLNHDEVLENMVAMTKGVSLEKAELLLKQFPTLRDLTRATDEEIVLIDGIGWTMAERIVKQMNHRYGDD